MCADKAKAFQVLPPELAQCQKTINRAQLYGSEGRSGDMKVCYWLNYFLIQTTKHFHLINIFD